ncbi:DUF3662 domain-containing protein [Kocuria rhizophila]|nr:DUF3662 domain-containing protein [Kocuria rhizophila]
MPHGPRRHRRGPGVADQVVLAAGVNPRVPSARRGQTTVLGYRGGPRRRAPVGERVAIMAAAASASAWPASSRATLADFYEEWGRGPHPQKRAADCCAPPAAPLRRVSVLQRTRRPGARLGTTTGWIHRAELRMADMHASPVCRAGGSTSRACRVLVPGAGAAARKPAVRRRPGPGPVARRVRRNRGGGRGPALRELLVPADTVVLCAGQESVRSSWTSCRASVPCTWWAAHVASKLDAKRAVEEGVELAASLPDRGYPRGWGRPPRHREGHRTTRPAGVGPGRRGALRCTGRAITTASPAGYCSGNCPRPCAPPHPAAARRRRHWPRREEAEWVSATVENGIGEGRCAPPSPRGRASASRPWRSPSALRRELTGVLRSLRRAHHGANVFTVEFSDERLPASQELGVRLGGGLCNVVIRHARSQAYTLQGAVRVSFVREPQLETGQVPDPLVLRAHQHPAGARGRGDLPREPAARRPRRTPRGTPARPRRRRPVPPAPEPVVPGPRRTPCP